MVTYDLSASVHNSFFSFAPEFRGGSTVASGDVNNDGVLDVIAGAGPGQDSEPNRFVPGE